MPDTCGLHPWAGHPETRQVCLSLLCDCIPMWKTCQAELRPDLPASSPLPWSSALLLIWTKVNVRTWNWPRQSSDKAQGPLQVLFTSPPCIGGEKSSPTAQPMPYSLGHVAEYAQVCLCSFFSSVTSVGSKGPVFFRNRRQWPQRRARKVYFLIT